MLTSSTRSSTAHHILRYLTLLTAIANAGGNLAILLFYRPIFGLLGVPLPKDLFSFVFVSCFSFTVGVLAYLIFRNPEKSSNLLVVGCLGKAAYSAATAYFFYEEELHWFYRVFGVWDGRRLPRVALVLDATERRRATRTGGAARPPCTTIPMPSQSC